MGNDITLDDFIFEARDDSALFALYAGLRMYKEQKLITPAPKNAFSIAGAEAYCMLQDLKSLYPKQYKECELEYEEQYGKLISVKFDKKSLPI